MSFVGHLEELRWHVIRGLALVIFFTIFAFATAPWIFENIIFAPSRVDFPTFRVMCQLGNLIGATSLCVDEIQFDVQSRYMTGQFTMHLLASFVIGVILAFPFIVWELWRFVKPALYAHERQNSRGAVAAISFLFLSGVLFGYYVLSPIMISFLANYRISDMIHNEFDITSYVSTVVGMVFATAMLFQLPVFIFFLTSIGVLTPEFLRKYRKHSILVILVLSAVITPSADILSQALISMPLYLLFEISILISANVRRKQLAVQTIEKN